MSAFAWDSLARVWAAMDGCRRMWGAATTLNSDLKGEVSGRTGGRSRGGG